MRYEVTHGAERYRVELREIGPDRFEVRVDEGDLVVVDVAKTPRTVYSVLLGNRQFEASVDVREDGSLDIHVGSSAFDFTAVDERRKLLLSGGGAAPTGVQEIRAQMPGKIVKVLVETGQRVAADEGLVIIEAMKMENEIRSPIDGVVTRVEVAEGAAVETAALLVIVEPPEAGS